MVPLSRTEVVHENKFRTNNDTHGLELFSQRRSSRGPVELRSVR